MRENSKILSKTFEATHLSFTHWNLYIYIYKDSSLLKYQCPYPSLLLPHCPKPTQTHSVAPRFLSLSISFSLYPHISFPPSFVTSTSTSTSASRSASPNPSSLPSKVNVTRKRVRMEYACAGIEGSTWGGEERRGGITKEKKPREENGA